jgi:hypothetical protein
MLLKRRLYKPHRLELLASPADEGSYGKPETAFKYFH